VRKADKLTTSMCECLEIWGLQPPGTLRVCPGMYIHCFILLEHSGSVQACTYIASASWNTQGLSRHVHTLLQPPGTLRVCPGMYIHCFSLLEHSGSVQACTYIASASWNTQGLSRHVHTLLQPPGTLGVCPGMYIHCFSLTFNCWHDVIRSS